jgi:hypothetical protein
VFVEDTFHAQTTPDKKERKKGDSQQQQSTIKQMKMKMKPFPIWFCFVLLIVLLSTKPKPTPNKMIQTQPTHNTQSRVNAVKPTHTASQFGRGLALLLLNRWRATQARRRDRQETPP